MLKTYLYVPDELNREVEALATAGKTSKAAVIRSALDAGVKMLKRKKTGSVEVLNRIAEIGRKYNLKGPKDASAKMNEYLWDKDWNKKDE
ncbi:MAG: hypothetical protein UX85_C0003G0132 [Candidatus Beckwithbacteria bacterium GW2011_GWB1_47_15]|uniref:Ribbon-helix-helix protein CopG domain-containing protein n=1 Tax=Candidatus Beckwithbacteria bacterium GW2011_GWB1_47_15 TaxID=1618371 RepID=A0A0G1U573_9BACT|nr:MAG: hypothetical protein UY43_C0001G0332 [Candidatus Beckwithbacteria bacterium GW2011_GWC1_49_16]KKU35378.1 MAG: hypothetical protein UX50_C0004G0109 [Candidatus Beckwithbacteria bacterium GW2011_GWA1_46_30]KKU61473.1 MAG: hypothetical protein UX85_C0003G0132 [Candidatus Beckwithbacteria bacterium GW2011_GWB1_47_15]KKU71004.1 MAG: hypothetical protein UX97_C0014G0006 [Candidatus Beckwithbacteria bacterium GW2011_GWA2_47_25]KKW03775.1 MAG: hypothetical protein UY37_C0004G0068 [Candidatus Be